ncbi:unnamed protein product (macronuclear) [Paramecium tetraurelia]|uniref:Mitochondrial import inner membrane translocase subunit n=2 Tax=Paramecium TaxID=5884 RepID=A0D0G9_PARTE|nr:uncharacterized protein GSPATT00012088001 [Paramecium tetraurelia]CAD8154505.1 unnamed protein product [Paramecium octaurelia]CAK76536.1 unnamed protein product [Paramecium tetraurelia]|eukprot:XP_001443933.1 hypothetical protein (macronuclear) [Paramecium tetraurelia strain d4-2]
MSDHDTHIHQNITIQQKNERIKQSITTSMKLSLMNIYQVCSKFCIKDYKKKDLSDREKICLSRCFERKNETLQTTMEFLGKLEQASD